MTIRWNGLRQRLTGLRGGERRERHRRHESEPLRLGPNGRFLPDYVAFDDEI